MAELSGKWLFQETIALPNKDIEQAINFSTKKTIDDIFYTLNCSAIKLDVSSYELLNYLMESTVPESDYRSRYETAYNNGRLGVFGFFEEGLRTIDFGDTEQTVSAEFYEWFTANAVQQDTAVSDTPTEPDTPAETPAATISHNGEVVATINGGQTATLKCTGMKMAGDVVVAVVEQTGGGEANIVPLTVSENGIFDTAYLPDTEIWDDTMEYDIPVSVSSITIGFRKAKKLSVPVSCSMLNSIDYLITMSADGEEQTISILDGGGVVDVMGDGSVYGIVESMPYLVWWVKTAATVNDACGTAFEDNTVYVSNLYSAIGAPDGWVISLTAPGKEKADGFLPVTVELPLEDELSINAADAIGWYERTYDNDVYYRKVKVKGIQTQSLTVTPNTETQTFEPAKNEPYSRVVVNPVDLSDLSSMKVLCGIYLETSPTKTDYVAGEWLSTSDGVILRQFTDGTTDRLTLTNGDVVNFLETFIPGEYILTVGITRDGVTSKTIYPITVAEPTEVTPASTHTVEIYDWYEDALLDSFLAVFPLTAEVTENGVHFKDNGADSVTHSFTYSGQFGGVTSVQAEAARFKPGDSFNMYHFEGTSMEKYPLYVKAL